MKEKLIVALDVSSKDEALRLIDELNDTVGAFKIGLQLFLAAGSNFVRELTARGIRIFLDLKFHDIPNTTARAAVEATKLGVWMFNVHALGGFEMMQRTAEEVINYCESTNSPKPKIIGVTVLTSSGSENLKELGFEGNLDSYVVKLAGLAKSAGLDGVVASAQEASEIKKAWGEDFLVVTPGIRLVSETSQDQKRVMTPRDAVLAGSDFLVVGRPILQSKNRFETVQKILNEMENAR